MRAGAKLAANPREVAAQADVLITIVSDPPALEEVLCGPRRARSAAQRNDPDRFEHRFSGLARREAAACAERGVDFLDAPVTGGTWGAEKGELVFMIGGEAEVLERASRSWKRSAKNFSFSGQTARAKP